MMLCLQEPGGGIVATDVQRIIDTILSSSRVQESRAFEGRTFADEPILRRGSQMESYLPDKIREMRLHGSLATQSHPL